MLRPHLVHVQHGRKNIYLQIVDVNLGFVISQVIGFDQVPH